MKKKMQCFLNCLSIMFKERIEYDNLKMMEEEMRKMNLFYDQNKNKISNVPS